MLAALGGLVLGVVVIYADRHWWTPGERAFASSGSFLFWAALISAQTMLWTLAFVPLTSILRSHWRDRASYAVRREVLPSTAVLVSLAALLVAVPRLTGDLPEVVPGAHVKIAVLTGLALIVAAVASISIWLIRGRAEELPRGSSFGQPELATYLRLRSDLELLLAFLGAVIGLAVLASAALRHVALLKDKTADFRPRASCSTGSRSPSCSVSSTSRRS
jgi:hypothetical protein